MSAHLGHQNVLRGYLCMIRTNFHGTPFVFSVFLSKSLAFSQTQTQE